MSINVPDLCSKELIVQQTIDIRCLSRSFLRKIISTFPHRTYAYFQYNLAIVLRSIRIFTENSIRLDGSLQEEERKEKNMLNNGCKQFTGMFDHVFLNPLFSRRCFLFLSVMRG